MNAPSTIVSLTSGSWWRRKFAWRTFSVCLSVTNHWLLQLSSTSCSYYSFPLTSFRRTPICIILCPSHSCFILPDGRRMATCSGDRFVRIWDLAENGDWNLNAEFQGHKGSVASLSWAHPEYGSLMATAGADGEAKIWEERTNATTSSSRWSAKAQLTEARKALSCVEFSPRHFGLKLATGSGDG